MKLAHEAWDFVIRFQDDRVHTLVVEHPETFRDIMEDIFRQQQGETGFLVLSHNDKDVTFSKGVEVIVDPLRLDVNQRKILSGLYKSLETDVRDTELFSSFMDLQQRSLQLMSDIDFQCVTDLQWHENLDVVAFLKYMQVQVQEESQSMMEKLVHYMRLYSLYVMPCGVFVIVNLKSWITEEEYATFVSACLAEHFYVLLVETHDSYGNEDEMKWIIDQDLCYIYNEE